MTTVTTQPVAEKNTDTSAQGQTFDDVLNTDDAGNRTDVFTYMADLDGDGELDPLFIAYYKNVNWQNYYEQYQPVRAKEEFGGKVPKSHSDAMQVFTAGAGVFEKEPFKFVDWKPISVKQLRADAAKGIDTPTFELEAPLGADPIPDHMSFYVDGTWTLDKLTAIDTDDLTKAERRILAGEAQPEYIKKLKEQTGADDIQYGFVQSGDTVYVVRQETYPHLKPLAVGPKELE